MPLSDPVYDGYRNLIEKKYRSGVDLDRIKYCTFRADKEPSILLLDNFLKDHAPYILTNPDQTQVPEITTDEWFLIYDQEIAILDSESHVVVGLENNQDFNPSADVHSNWMRYLWKLRTEKGYSIESVNSITDSCVKVLKRLVNDTTAYGNNAVKGLVVGNVQSGKTGNMAGVIAMAADAGFNFFIVLSGLIENLRVQTEERLIRDLSKVITEHGYDKDPYLSYSWYPVSHPDPNSDCLQLNCLQLTDNSNDRYLTVCLKQSNRLRNLIAYLQQNPNYTKNLKILIIDDECDQGSVNTADISEDKKSALYELITGVCDHKTFGNHYRNSRWRDHISEGEPFKAINYIAYTATPYATLLNDARHESLFPRNFIVQLKPSKNYIGGRMFFGDADGEPDSGFGGHPYLNQIPDEEVHDIANIQTCTLRILPNELRESILWFLATAATQRVRGRNNIKHNPVSMLIHTAQYTADHARLGDMVRDYIEELSTPFKENNNSVKQTTVLNAIESVYNKQCKKLTLTIFRTKYPWYGELDSQDVCDYLAFSDIKQELSNILSYGLNHININEDLAVTYSKGIHFCIDNSRNTGVQNADENGTGQYLRIKYPDPDEVKLDYEPIFLVIGGNTLARGLTLEGLTTTYFSRQVNQIDTLQQMGRFFGHRPGYELLPRVWVSEAMRVNFRNAYLTDESIRKQIEALPENFNLYELCLMIQQHATGAAVTAKNKQQNAVLMPVLSGRRREVAQFSRASDDLKHNEKLIRSFVGNLGAMKKGVAYGKSNYYVEGVSWNEIRDVICKYKFTADSDFCPEVVVKYVEIHLAERNWTVILAGHAPSTDNARNFIWNDGEKECIIGKNLRTSYTDLEENKGWLGFRSAISAADFLTDVCPAVDCPSGMLPFNNTQNVIEYRAKASLNGKGQNPVFIISCLNALDKQRNPVPGDMFGFSIGFPLLSKEETLAEVSSLFVGNLEE